MTRDPITITRRMNNTNIIDDPEPNPGQGVGQGVGQGYGGHPKVPKPLPYP